MEKKARLGRGLEALLGNGPHQADPLPATAAVALDRIEHNPFQPRKAFDDEELASLTASIRTHGVLQPLVVRPLGEQFQLIAGERRFRAARDAGLASVPIHVVDFNDQQVLEAALVENIHRTDLNPIEKAQGFKEYLDRFQVTHDQLAGRLGLRRPTISNLLGLLEPPPEIQDLVRTGQVTLGHAKILKGVADPRRQKSLCTEIIARGLSVHALDALLKDSPEAEAEPSATAEPTPAVEKTAHVRSLEDELRQRLAVKVEIRLKAKDRGMLVLSFDCNDDFERLVEALRK